MVRDTAKGGMTGTPDHYKEAARQMPPLASAFNAENNPEDPTNPLTAVLGSYGARTRADLNRIAHDLQAGGHGSSIQKRSDAAQDARYAGSDRNEEERREKERGFYRQIAMLQQQLAEQLYQINKKIDETDKKIVEIKNMLDRLALEREAAEHSLNRMTAHLSEQKELQDNRLEADEKTKELKDKKIEALLREYEKRNGKIDRNNKGELDYAIEKIIVEQEQNLLRIKEEQKAGQNQLSDHEALMQDLQKEKLKLEKSAEKIAVVAKDLEQASASGDPASLTKIAEKIDSISFDIGGFDADTHNQTVDAKKKTDVVPDALIKEDGGANLIAGLDLGNKPSVMAQSTLSSAASIDPQKSSLRDDFSSARGAALIMEITDPGKELISKNIPGVKAIG